MKTMMRYAWKVALLGVGAMVVACSDGMTMGTMSTASAGPTSSGSSTNGSSGTGASSGTGGGGTCTCAAQVLKVQCTGPSSDMLQAVAMYPGMTAQEIAGRVTAVYPAPQVLSGVSNAYQGFFPFAEDGQAFALCTNGQTEVWFVMH